MISLLIHLMSRAARGDRMGECAGTPSASVSSGHAVTRRGRYPFARASGKIATGIQGMWTAGTGGAGISTCAIMEVGNLH